MSIHPSEACRQRKHGVGGQRQRVQRITRVDTHVMAESGPVENGFGRDGRGGRDSANWARGLPEWVGRTAAAAGADIASNHGAFWSQLVS